MTSHTLPTPGSQPNSHFPASSTYKYIQSTSFRTATSLICTFGKMQPKRRLRNSSRFKTATLMPWTLLRGILTSSKKRLQMIHRRLFSYKMTRVAQSTSRNCKKQKGMRIVFKYCFPIYAELQILRVAPQFFGLGPDTISLSWPLLAPKQRKNAGGHCCRPPVPASPMPLWQHWPANTAQQR